jgi:hypothetical protein
MNTKLTKRLEKLAEQCEALAIEIRATLSYAKNDGALATKRMRAKIDVNVSEITAQLWQQPRDQANARLGKLSQKILARICRDVGGSSADAKKTKDDLIKKILWKVFDFDEGHNILIEKQ